MDRRAKNGHLNDDASVETSKVHSKRQAVRLLTLVILEKNIPFETPVIMEKSIHGD